MAEIVFNNLTKIFPDGTHAVRDFSLTIADGEVLPVKRVRGNQKAVQEFARAFAEDTVDEPSLRVGIASADAPERVETVRRLVEDVRPKAQIEIATTLGAVVGTHAGPGTVGFFWFDD